MANYYAFFDNISDNARVFAEDQSGETSTVLTPREAQARRAWHGNLIILQQHYKYSIPPPVQPLVTSRETLLQQRFAPPYLSPDNASSRSRMAEPRDRQLYPSSIAAWSDFKMLVNAFIVTPIEEANYATVIQPVHFARVFVDSLSAQNDLSTEYGEQSWLLTMLKETLQRAGIAKFVGGSRGLMGNMDFHVLSLSGQRTIMCESKSTQNLCLPLLAVDVATKYNAAYTALHVNNSARTTEWNVCHPLAQLFRYMVDNQYRFGALTSATRTYFVRLTNEANPTF
jgi:hypothetical protein